ncbi:GNAT family N-acetyltransferase [Ideonella sp. DXS22W]|uniref:GNAT family N-acetyltransferase n=1 Tax=Pseudaquabacterium inlustre TaxID=2984192 RepID=A0ABU9CB28_9BURK
MTGTPPAWQLLPASADDFDALAELRIAAMRESLERVGRFDPQRARERLRAGFSPAHTRHIVAGGQRVGFVVVLPQPVSDDAPAHWRLEHLYLHPDAQGRGLGAAVLRQVMAEADAAGLELRLGALRDSDANRFYLRHGFALIGRSEFDNHYRRLAPR